MSFIRLGHITGFNADRTSISPPTDYGNLVESHWATDANGQLFSTHGQIQEVASDANTADLENLESLPLPPNATPPPAPRMQNTGRFPPFQPEYRNFAQQSHWTTDVDGQFFSAHGEIQDVASDANTADLEKLESLPLPPHSTPPPPPRTRVAKLPSISQSGGPSGRTSRMGFSPRGTDSGVSEEPILAPPPGGSQPSRFSNRTSGGLAELLTDSPPAIQQTSPRPPFLPSQPLYTSPPAVSSIGLPELSNKHLRFSPFSGPPGGRATSPLTKSRPGSSLKNPGHQTMNFEPTSTSSPPRGQSRSPPDGPKQKVHGRPLPDPANQPPRGPAEAPPNQQAPRPSRRMSSPPRGEQHPYPGGYHPTQPPNIYYAQAPINLPPLHEWPQMQPVDQHARPSWLSEDPPTPARHGDGWRSNNERYAAPNLSEQEILARAAYEAQQQGQYSYPFTHFPPGYTPYPMAEMSAHAWAGHTVHRADEPNNVGQVPPPPGLPHPPSNLDAPASKGKAKVWWAHPSGPGYPAPSQPQQSTPMGQSTLNQSKATGETLSKLFTKLNASVVHKHWTDLDSYFKKHSDQSYTAFVERHTSISSRLGRILRKIVDFLIEAPTYDDMQIGSARWRASWEKQLSSLDRTMDAFCRFSSVICDGKRTKSFAFLERVLVKIKEYEEKFKNLAKKIHALISRLQLCRAYSALVKAHTEAREQLRLARSRRDLPKWDEEKRRRNRLRGDYLQLRERMASSRKSSWAA